VRRVPKELSEPTERRVPNEVSCEAGFDGQRCAFPAHHRAPIFFVILDTFLLTFDVFGDIMLRSEAKKREGRRKKMATTSFSGGEVRGNAVYGTEVWNRDPLPPPQPPRVYTYRLLVRNGEYEATATSTTMEELISFELQMRELGYEFIRLERLEEE